jgi:hypothetical protein
MVAFLAATDMSQDAIDYGIEAMPASDIPSARASAFGLTLAAIAAALPRLRGGLPRWRKTRADERGTDDALRPPRPDSASARSAEARPGPRSLAAPVLRHRERRRALYAVDASREALQSHRDDAAARWVRRFRRRRSSFGARRAARAAALRAREAHRRSDRPARSRSQDDLVFGGLAASAARRLRQASRAGADCSRRESIRRPAIASPRRWR